MKTFREILDIIRRRDDAAMKTFREILEIIESFLALIGSALFAIVMVALLCLFLWMWTHL